jgi:hypothetical protein
MIKFVRQSAMAAGLVALSMASTASWAASGTATYEFKTFFDTSTPDALDTKTLNYSVATLKMTDLAGGNGIELTLTQNNHAFASKGGNFIDALYLAGPVGSFKLNSKDQMLSPFGGYSSHGFKVDNYTYQWDIDFFVGSFSEGETAKLTILGNGLNVAKFGATPMLNLDNAGKPYATGFLGLSDNVHFVGTLATAPVPEASSYAMLGLGLIGLGFFARRRQQA